MGKRYTYFSINKNLENIWTMSTAYWRTQKKVFINHETSYAANTHAKLHFHKQKSFKQSEEYFIKFVRDKNDPNLTHVKVFFEYLGENFVKTNSQMEKLISNWTAQLNVPSLQFYKHPEREYEAFFSDILEDYQKPNKVKEEKYCKFCGNVITEEQDYCNYCNTKVD
ncbi:MAG: hypothetical protein ACFFAS_14990 [Promethearchaeota archaeon]